MLECNKIKGDYLIMAQMKVRAIILVDYVVDSYEDAAKEHKKIKDTMKDLLENNKCVQEWQSDLRERRGSGMPDIHKIKVRM